MSCDEHLCEDFSIVLLTKGAESEKRLVADKLARESCYAHCYFDPQNPKDPHTFIAFFRGEAAGFLLMDLRYHDYSAPIDSVRNGIFAWEKIPAEWIWSTVCIWVKPEYRRRGIAKKLYLAGCCFFNTNPKEMGWSTPVSELGVTLLKAMGVDLVRLA